MKKRIASMVLALVMLVGLLPGTVLAANTPPTYSGGTGTEADPYLLATKEDLVTLKDFVNSGGAVELDVVDNCGLGSYHGYYFKMTKDIDMQGVEWTPFSFNGTFDGAGHTISNMQMNENFFESADPANNEYKSAEYEAAFFGQVVHATIKNLYFENCSAKISDGLDPSSSRDIYVGIVATTAIASSFENISAINCTVTQNGKDGNFAYSGGLVGYADICHFEFCSFDGTITTGGDATSSQNVGGIVGGVGDSFYWYINDYDNPYNMVVGAGKDFGMYHCFSTAKITNPCFSSSAGIAGFLCTDYISATFENCAFGGEITTDSSASGIVGQAEPNDVYKNCVVYAENITTSDRACAIGMYRTWVGSAYEYVGVDVTDCKISSSTQISGTEGVILNGLTPVELATDEEKIAQFKSNLYGKLADESENVTITLSQENEVKYTATTDADGEYNFGKLVLPGTYTLKIAEGDYKAVEESVVIPYATNVKKEIVRTANHQHSWTYHASGNKIEAVCGGTGTCPANKELTISKPLHESYGDGNAANAVLSAESIGGIASLPDIVYEGTGETAYAESTTAPTDAGTYKASITIDTDKTAEVEYTVAKATLTVVGTGVASGTYGDTLSELTISGLTAKLSETDVPGTWSLSGDTVPDVGDIALYTATFTPTTGAQNYNELTVQVTVNLSKDDQQAPAAPTGSYAVSGTDATKFVYTINTVANAQYKMDNGSWQDSNVFDGVAPESDHTFYVRLKATTNYHESEASEGKLVTFAQLPNNTAPALNYTVSGDATARVITITAVEGAEYSFDGGSTWQDSNVKDGIDGTDRTENMVTITIRYKETAVYQPSVAAQTVQVNTTKPAQVIPNPTYTPTVEDSIGGHTTVSDKTPQKGDTVLITTNPDEGYEVDKVIVTDGNGNPVTVTENRDGTYSFVQPVGAVMITVTYAEVDVPCDGGETCPGNPYEDVDTDAWYHEAIDYVVENGIMNGTSEDTFNPYGTLTRAMLMTMLARADGEDTTGGETWWSKGLEWAVENEISDGTNPEADITREQMVVMLYRYAVKAGYNVSAKADISTFNDADSVSSWAVEAMQWAVGAGIIEGSSNNLNPTGNAERCQVAAVFMRFMEAIDAE